VSTDDDDIGDVWRAHRQASQDKRASNREESARLLAIAGITFSSKNSGAHLVVTAGLKTIDFWPGTGLWQERGAKKGRRGVQSLIQHCRT
jgi:hypothetical protein